MNTVNVAVDPVRAVLGPPHRALLPVLAYVVLLVSALQTLVIPVVEQIAVSLQVSSAAASWIVTANLLSAAITTPVLVRLGDLFGSRRTLLGVLIVVGLGSLLGALATSLPLLIGARVLQGMSYAIYPLAMGIIRDVVPAPRSDSATATVSGMLAVGGGIALVATGLVSQAGGTYQHLFWLAFLLTAAGVVGVWLAVPARPATDSGRVDVTGAAVLAVAMVLLLLPLSEGGTWGWGSPATIGMFVGAAAAFAVFAALQLHSRSPLIPPRMLTVRPVVIVNAVGLLQGFVLFVGFLVVSRFAQEPVATGYGFGASVLTTSLLYLLPGAAAGIVIAPLAGRMVRRIGPAWMLAGSMLLTGAGLTALILFHAHPWQVIVGSLLVNAAITGTYAGLPTLLAQHIATAETGVANSVNFITRTVGSSIASAVVGVILAAGINPASGEAGEGQYVIAWAVGVIVAVAGALLVPLVRTEKAS